MRCRPARKASSFADGPESTDGPSAVEGSRTWSVAIPPGASREVQVRAADRQDPRGPLEAAHDRGSALLAQSIRGVECHELALLAELVDPRGDGGVLHGREERPEHVVRTGGTKRGPGGLVERRADPHGADGPELVDQNLMVDLGGLELLEGQRREQRRVGAPGPPVRGEGLLVDRDARGILRGSRFELHQGRVFGLLGEQPIGGVLSCVGVRFLGRGRRAPRPGRARTDEDS